MIVLDQWNPCTTHHLAPCPWCPKIPKAIVVSPYTRWQRFVIGFGDLVVKQCNQTVDFSGPRLWVNALGAIPLYLLWCLLSWTRPIRAVRSDDA